MKHPAKNPYRALGPSPTREQVDQIRSNTDQATSNAVLLMFLTGARRADAVAFRRKDVDLSVGTLTFQNRGPAAGFDLDSPTQKFLALRPEAIDLVSNLCDGLESNQFLIHSSDPDTPVHPDALSYRFRKACLKAKVPPMRLHDLRWAEIARLAAIQKG